jgi:2-polyprenyl-3-methyl-5-hydroxy-6-metoxy-1,4-benzoquinol methylase
VIKSENLAARIEPFDSFWENPEDVEKGYDKFGQFYRYNYLPHLPKNTHARILVISSGPGYFLNLLRAEGFEDVIGIDSRQEQIDIASRRQLPCERARAFEYLTASNEESFDVIVCEQELNHLKKSELRAFLALCYSRLRKQGRLICHALNGANPIVGAESLAQNFDHYNTFTEYSLDQILAYSGFTAVKVFPLHLYVFFRNPANYVLWTASALLHLMFTALFIMYGKSNRLWTKKIGAVCEKP